MERRYAMLNRYKLIGLLLAVTALPLMTACQTEIISTAPPEVKMSPSNHTLTGLSDVFQGDRRIGTLRTYRFNGDNHREFIRVYNLRNDDLGYITDDGRAFRIRAHGGPDLVANNTDLSKNVAAVFGLPLQKMEIKVVASAQ